MTEPLSPKGPVKAGSVRAEPEPVEADAGYRVSLPTFEGPLDLLLHLIQKHELDILDIPIGFITEKYVEYITKMQQVSIDIASEYLVMAANLAHIKSKMLLPPSPEEAQEAEEFEGDPRAELVRRLLEYQKYKQAAEQLSSRSVLGRDLFARGMPAPAAEGPAPLAPVSLFKLLDALETVLERVRRTQDHLIDFERISISDRINQLSDILKVRQRVIFDELFAADRTRADVIVTFLALLEMTRLRLTRIHQVGPLEPILIELAVVEEAEGGAQEVIASAGTEEDEPALDSRSEEGETLGAAPAGPEPLEGTADETDGDGEVGEEPNRGA